MILNCGIVNKPSNLWNTEDKRKVKVNFKAKYLMKTTLNTRVYFYIFNYNNVKKKYETLLKRSKKIKRGLPYLFMKMKHQVKVKVTSKIL